ncbi:MAG: M13 family metallopeptidase [Rubrivivax sp.]|nr:M13 family metallopeptidase [Rubrivivax sp.]
MRLFTLIAAATLGLTQPVVHAETAAACTDFDSYVNGRWAATTELPADRSRIGNFDTLRLANDRLLEAALKELAAEPARQTSSGLQLLAAHYRAGMDEAGIERRGLAALQPWLTRIEKAERADLPALLGELARLQVTAPLAIGVGTDAKDATRHVLQVNQAGLGLPDRDDYLRQDERTARLTAAYRQYAQRLLGAAGVPADETTIDALLAFETELARASLTRVQRRDPNAAYNPYTVAALQADAPGLDWRAWLAAYTGRAEGAPVIVGQPGFTRAVAQLADKAAMATWRNYLRVRLLDATAEHGPKALAQAHFVYRSAAIRGLKAPPPRVERVILMIGGAYGGAPLSHTLGELFVVKAFSRQAQQRALVMVDDIRAAMRQRITKLPWMSEPTKQLAQAKLDAMRTKIGAPAAWRRYDGLALHPDDYLGNLLRINAWATADRLVGLDKPVDRERWNTSPHIVNAFAGGGNQIIFPAGILQPPFFDEKADDASNYGGIGMVIGHEITHHFDDRGRQFDAAGNLRDWWQPQDASAYKARADRVATLYSGYEPVPGVRIDGRLTLGENISDMAGVQIAYDGLQIALARQRAAGKPAALVDGATPEQRFFLANATIWRTKYRTEALMDQLRTNSHSPGRWRVLGPLTHTPAFAQAFGCKPGDPMVAGDPITVW